MKVLRVVFVVFGAVLCSVACGGGGGGDGPDPGGGSVAKLNPPANIDIEVCSSVATEDLGANAECAACCTQHAYSGSTDHEGLCICGKDRDNAGETVCSTQTASAELCGSCCSTANFNGRSWIGGTGTAECRCFDRFDREICATALEGSEPSDSCRVCCLNNGYLGMSYSNFGTPECRCSGG